MKYILLIFVCGLFIGCFNEGNCLITATNGLHIQFKKKSNSTTDTIKIDSIVVDGRKFVATPTSDVLPSAAVTELVIPLDTNLDSTLILFYKTNSGTPERMTLGYARQAKVISKDCGAYTYFQNLRILKTNLDTVTQIKVFSKNLIRNPTISYKLANSYALNYQIFH